jgi:threonylcarbamoyladenosine tRNA methylthiotransferase MtaB
MNRGPSVSFHTLGCKLNFAETSTIGKQLREAGFRKVEFETGADVYVINTCSVTENADKECRNLVRRALQRNPDAFIAIIGCYAQLKPEEISQIPGVDLILGASEKFNLPQYLSDLHKQGFAQVHSCEVSDVNRFIASESSGDRTRAFLKVQDGCDYPCTYCTIPLARGASRSDTIDNVVRRVEKLADSGIREVVLTGVNLGDFGTRHDPDGRTERPENFLQLAEALDRINGIERFRISSIEPNLLRDEIIAFVAGSKRFVPHFHLPLQSGSDRILASMKRRYRTQLYADRVASIRKWLPHAAIGVDVITGFPGEGEEEFRETFDFLHALPVSYFHVFTYSERDSTKAALMDGKVPVPSRKDRTRQLRNLSEKKHRAFLNTFIGSVRPVLFESEESDGNIHGYTDNYIRVSAPYSDSLVNRVVTVRLGDFNPEGLLTVSGSGNEVPILIP